MTVNDIKKALYKQKPIATQIETNDKNIVYLTTLNMPENEHMELKFIVPLKEAENFDIEMPAQLLIRWLVLNFSIKLDMPPENP